MKLNLFLLIVTLIGIFSVTFWWEDLTAIKGSYQKAPDFIYTDINGTTGNLYQHTNKTILVHFWATWCAPCLVEFPEIIKLAEQFPDQLIVLGISADRKSEDVEQFLLRNKLGLPQNFINIVEPDQNIMTNIYGVDKLPESFLLAKDFHIVNHVVGASDQWGKIYFHNKIKSLRTGGNSVHKK